MTDVNECSKTNLCNCPSNSTCNNTVGGYDCLCLPGFNKNISTNQCDDIDECKDNTFTCPSDSACNNTVGGYNCNCISGYFRNFTSKTCQVCQPFYYGEFCSQSCACNSSNANSCNNVNGTCSCKSQWRGTDCTTDVDECQENTHTCLNNSHCTNVNGGYTCDCNPGYFKNTTSNSCQTCACNMSNTVSCDSISGFCLCKTNWQGPTCNDDVNECSKTNLYNCPSNSTCNNTVGGYDCLCLPGFNKNISTNQCDDIDECKDNTFTCPSDSACNNTVGGYNCNCISGYFRNFTSKTCQVCQPFYYGEFCSQSCACNSSNANSCNNVNGTCSCKSQWRGTDCTTDVDECQENTHTCLNNSHCTNVNGGYTCDCNPGYFKNTTSNSCQTCACNMSNAVSCDPISGSCVCNSSWQGLTCNNDVDECSNTNLNNCPSNSTCNNTLGGYECLCTSGFKKNISTNKCDECVADRYGYNCNNVCSCNTSNSACNKTDGTCKCNSGWTGAACNDDINECNIVGSICSTSKLETCYNIPGSYVCDCRDGYWRENDTSVCTKLTEKQFKITLTYNASGYNLTDVNEYNDLRNKTYIFLKDFFNQRVEKLRKVEIKNLSYGSLIVDFKLYYDENQDPVATSLALKALLDAKNLTLDNQSVTVQSINASETNLTSTSTLCEIRKVVQKCADNEVCTENGTASVCIPSTPADNRLTIGLAVGIPLFCLFCAAIVIGVCYYVRKKKNKRLNEGSADNESYFHQPFSSTLPTRGIWDRRSHPGSYLNERLSGISSDSSDDHVPQPKKYRFDDSYKDSAWKKDKKKEDPDQSRFTWDFLYKTLGIDEEFQIPRPQLDPGHTSDI
ncbi:hypothetical protein Btru_055742 [Bulinus truncatus]|nr:hypothetical protein Btru_055742 [Bulinus truncatus]